MIVEPLRCIPKARVPLHYFDFQLAGRTNTASRIFRAQNANLEAYLGKDQGSLLLLVQINHTSQLAAIERLNVGLFSITFFSSGVTFLHLSSNAPKCLGPPRKIRRVEPSSSGLNSWWLSAALEHDIYSRAPLLGSKCAKSTAGQSERQPTFTAMAQNLSPERRQSDPHSESAAAPTSEPADTESTVNTIVTSVVEQYLDALYLSRTSLAYFPKSTLSRARTAALGSAQDYPRLREYASHLRGMVLSPINFDKKYRATIPDAIQGLSSRLEAKDNNTSILRPKKAKKLKKPKPGKSGLYSVENDLITRWWYSQEVTPSQSSGDDFARRVQADLRFREILLQVILVLEVLAIEASLPPSGSTPKNEAKSSNPTDSVEQIHEPIRGKPKKPVDLNNTLELLVDRLCIWQSIEALEDDQKSKQAKAQDSDKRTQHNPSMSSDTLQDFYHHVLVPFYAVRMRQKIEELAKRMGVLTQLSPPRPRSRHSVDKVPPGASMRRRRRQVSGSGLPRTLSDGSKPEGTRRASLTRSVTDSFLRTDPRERSTTLLEDSMRPPRRTLSRASSISSSTKLSQREVDLTAVARFNQSKPTRKASVDQELQQAIATLKKPNRGKAVEEYVNSLDNQKAQMSKRPWLKSKLGVEVGATPRKEQKVKDIPSFPAHPPGAAFDDVECTIPSTDPSVSLSASRASTVRNSALKPTHRPLDPNSQPLDVFETPSRRQTKRSQFVPASDRKFSGVTSSRPASGAAEQSKMIETVFTTPRKAQRVLGTDAVFQSSPPYVAQRDGIESLIEEQLSETPAKDRVLHPDLLGNGTRAGQTIYETLGWNDNDLDEIL